MNLQISRWKNLMKYEIDIGCLSALISEMGTLHIRNFMVSVKKFGIRTKYFQIPRHDYGEVSVMFDHQHQYSKHVITLRAVIYFGSHQVECVIRGTADYEYLGYDINIQDYLYTYFCNIVRSSKYLDKYRPMELPTKLSNYYPGCEWTPYNKTAYHRECPGKPLTVQEVSGVQSIPQILKVNKA